MDDNYIDEVLDKQAMAEVLKNIENGSRLIAVYFQYINFNIFKDSVMTLIEVDEGIENKEELTHELFNNMLQAIVRKFSTYENFTDVIADIAHNVYYNFTTYLASIRSTGELINNPILITKVIIEILDYLRNELRDKFGIMYVHSLWDEYNSFYSPKKINFNILYSAKNNVIKILRIEKDE